MTVLTRSLPTKNEFKTSMIQALGNAMKDTLDVKFDYQLITYNSKHFIQWDFINRNMVQSLSDWDEISEIRAQRGLWGFIMIYEQETGYLYAFMQQKNFGVVSKGQRQRTRPHYLDALASINGDLEVSEKFLAEHGKQIQLFDMDQSDWNNRNSEILREMLGDLVEKVERFVLVTFETRKGEISSINAYIPTADLGTAYEENWNEFIIADYSNETHAKPIYSEEQTEEEIVVGLRAGVVPQVRNDNDTHEEEDDILKIKKGQKDMEKQGSSEKDPMVTLREDKKIKDE